MISVETCGLLIVDVQGKLANMVTNSQTMISNISKLIRCCETLSMPIVVLEQNPDGLGTTTPAIQDSLTCFRPLKKYSFNALAESHIKEHIQHLNRRCWLVAGIETHVCVYQTVQGLLAEGLLVEVVVDCVSSRLQSNSDLAIDKMKMAGANMTSLEMCVFEMLKTCKAYPFREVLQIIK